ncbi:hypothetical protein QVD17_17518 [Tagetes erecta]|uniref:NIN-like protein n=1 Tax=Tagetes erecta TaxID=13708 RepID=A0AAD8KU28_TARER|nr:hypothetical protein QVD17_17518 [Tagetes erecta]
MNKKHHINSQAKQGNFIIHNLGNKQTQQFESLCLISSEPPEGYLEASNENQAGENDSSSDYFYFNDVSKFVKNFRNPPRHIASQSGQQTGPWVFCGNSSCSSSSGAADVRDNIISAFCNMNTSDMFFGQFWEPVTTEDGRLLLSTSSQPFVVTRLDKDLVMYRLWTEKYENMNYNEGHGGPATAFLNHLPYFNQFERMDGDFYSQQISIMLPICFPSDESRCVGVLEFIDYGIDDLWSFHVNAIKTLKKAGLVVICDVQKHIPYKTINGLRPTKDDIEHALEIICGSHNLSLAQVWIGFEDKSHVPCSSYLEDTQIFRLNLIGCLNVDDDKEGRRMFSGFKMYNDLCDQIPLRTGKAIATKTLLDFKSRYNTTFNKYGGISWYKFDVNMCALAICLRSTETGDFNFVFEFLWVKHSRRDILLESILLTLKKCLSRFKFASGEELGDTLDVIEVDHCINVVSNFKIFEEKTSSSSKEKALEKYLDVIGVESPTRGETSNINAFQGKRLSPVCKTVDIYKGKKPMVKYKTTKIELPLKDIEKHFDKTMKEAADILKVSTSTLKRKLREHGITEWPKKEPLKRNKSNNVSINQTESDKEDNGSATQKPATITIKAKYGDRMISSPFLISNATFENVFQEIGKKFELSFGTYRLEYLDKDEDWIWLASDEEMGYSIESSRKPDQTVVRLRVRDMT